MEVIRERTSLVDARHRAYIEWQTKVLAGFIASTAQSEKGARALHKAAQSLSMSPDSQSSDDVSVPPNEPRVGSYERLSGLFRSGMVRQ